MLYGIERRGREFAYLPPFEFVSKADKNATMLLVAKHNNSTQRKASNCEHGRILLFFNLLVQVVFSNSIIARAGRFVEELLVFLPCYRLYDGYAT